MIEYNQINNLEFAVCRLYSERANIMEFNVKLQELRKQKGLTQEELAVAIYVSRTAISKWESGRGYPGIDSLKAIAKYFGVSIDMLLSGDEVLSIAEAETSMTFDGTNVLLFRDDITENVSIV